jgi:hypothetical protein
MNDAVFRTATQSEPSEESVPTGKESSTGSVTDVEVPYLDYAKEKNHPYPVDHYQLGDRWQDPVGGFPKEIAVIEGYIEEKIKSGELANSVNSIKDYIKKLEKLNNIQAEERPLVKIETLAAYIEFLQKTDKLKQNLKRYGHS